jgi:hypothetical protein
VPSKDFSKTLPEALFVTLNCHFAAVIAPPDGCVLAAGLPGD